MFLEAPCWTGSSATQAQLTPISFRGGKKCKKKTKFDVPVAAKLHHSNQTWSVCRMRTETTTCALLTFDAPLHPGAKGVTLWVLSPGMPGSGEEAAKMRR